MHDDDHNGPFQILLVVLSIYVLAALSVELAIPLSSATKEILSIVDSGICLLFLADFFHRLARSPRNVSASLTTVELSAGSDCVPWSKGQGRGGANKPPP